MPRRRVKPEKKYRLRSRKQVRPGLAFWWYLAVVSKQCHGNRTAPGRIVVSYGWTRRFAFSPVILYRQYGAELAYYPVGG